MNIRPKFGAAGVGVPAQCLSQPRGPWAEKGWRPLLYTTHPFSYWFFSMFLQPGCQPLLCLGWPLTRPASGGSRSVGRSWAVVTMTTTSLGTGRPKQYAFISACIPLVCNNNNNNNNCKISLILFSAETFHVWVVTSYFQFKAICSTCVLESK